MTTKMPHRLQLFCVSFSLLLIIRSLTACWGCQSVSLIPHRRHTHMHAREVKKCFCVCRAVSRPRALTLAARSACLLMPLLGCHLLPASALLLHLLWTRWLETYRSPLFSLHFLFIPLPLGIKGNEGNPLKSLPGEANNGKMEGTGRWMWFIMRLLSFCGSTPGTAVWNGTPRLQTLGKGALWRCMSRKTDY